jgi:ferredoxin
MSIVNKKRTSLLNKKNASILKEKIPHWKTFIRTDLPVVIYHSTCGGGEECITACPYHLKIWEMQEMEVPFFGINPAPRKRPVMINPELCTNCYICVEACPTGSLVKQADFPIKYPGWKTTWYLLKLSFKKRYGLIFTLNKKHIKAFLRNNFHK